MGAAFNRVVNTLHATFPNQRILISELGYVTVGSDDQGSTWWWGSPTDHTATGAGAVAVASLYQSAVMSFPFSGGGTYWWYYDEVVFPNNPLWNAFSSVYKKAKA